MRAEWRGPTRAEIRVPGTAGVLICDYSAVTGEWEAVGISIDGEVKRLDALDIPPCFSLNDEAREALEALS